MGCLPGLVVRGPIREVLLVLYHTVDYDSLIKSEFDSHNQLKGLNVVQIWTRYHPKFDATKPSCAALLTVAPFSLLGTSVVICRRSRQLKMAIVSRSEDGSGEGR